MQPQNEWQIYVEIYLLVSSCWTSKSSCNVKEQIESSLKKNAPLVPFVCFFFFYLQLNIANQRIRCPRNVNKLRRSARYGTVRYGMAQWKSKWPKKYIYISILHDLHAPIKLLIELFMGIKMGCHLIKYSPK